MVFPKCGHLLTETERDLRLVPLFMFFLLKKKKISLSSKCQLCAAQSSHPRSFEYLQVLPKVICQPVTQSVGNVCFMLSAECGELFAEAAEQHGAWEAWWKWSRVTALGHSAVTGFLLWCCYCWQRRPSLLQTASKSYTYFKSALPLIPPVLLQLSIDSSA